MAGFAAAGAAAMLASMDYELADMESRVAKLEAIAEKAGERLVGMENRLIRIEAKQDEFTRHYATKADLTDAKNSIIMWVVGAIFLAQLLPTLLKKFGL